LPRKEFDDVVAVPQSLLECVPVRAVDLQQH
jgi:hypothetical protein